MSRKNIVAVDVDDVLVQFLPGFERTFSKVLGRPAIRKSTAWALNEAYGATPEELEAVWQGLEDFHTYRDLPFLPGAEEALRLLADAGYVVHAVTALQMRYKADRDENLRAVGFTPDRIHAVGYAPKAPVLWQLQPAFFADDQVKHLHAAPFVPCRVWIHTEDEQFPSADENHTHEAHSLLEFVEHWLEGNHQRIEAPRFAHVAWRA